MNKRYWRHLLFTALTSLVVASCKITQPYARPEVAAAQLYRGVSATDTATMASRPWRELFTDTILLGLINEGISRNLDLQMAVTRMQQAQAYYQQSRAAFLPSLDANAGVTRSKFAAGAAGGFTGTITQYQLGLSTRWEADIWGRLGSNRRASLVSWLQAEAAVRAVQTGLVASIANYYYLLLALDQQQAITQLTVSNWDTTVQTMRALKEAARVTEAAVVQSEAQRYAAEVTLPDLKQSIRETENALGILLGAPPSAVRRSTLQEQQPAALLQTGVPAQLLAYRPDVQEAELNFRYFFELTNVARTRFYPALTISGSGSLSSLALDELLRPEAVAASIAAGLLQPIYNQRGNKTRLEVARAQQQEALLNFRNTVLNAGREVSDALSLHDTALEKMQVRTRQMNALQSSADYSQELLQYGFANYTEVITARQSLLQAQLGGVNDHLQQLQAVVALYRSLGGGWK